MKSLLIAAILTTLTSTSAFATEEKYYSCDGVGDVEEHVVAIDLEQNIASFFDNDSYSYLKLTDELILESNPPQRVLTFEGPDASYEGTIKVVFNQTRLKVDVTSQNGEEGFLDLGEAKCKKGEPIVQD